MWQADAAMSEPTRAALLQLGDDLPALWRHPHSSAVLKKRIVRTLLHEIIVKQEAGRRQDHHGASLERR
jgi:hypothetical protein